MSPVATMQRPRTITFQLSQRERLSFLVFAPCVLIFLFYVHSSFDVLFGNSTMDKVARFVVSEFVILSEAMLSLGIARCFVKMTWLDRGVQFAFDHMLALASLMFFVNLVFVIVYIYFVLIPESLKE